MVTPPPSFVRQDETFLSFLSRLHVFEALPEVNDVLLLRVVKLVALGPVVGDSVGEDLSVGAESAASDRLLHRFRGLELCPRVLERNSISPLSHHKCVDK